VISCSLQSSPQQFWNKVEFSSIRFTDRHFINISRPLLTRQPMSVKLNCTRASLEQSKKLCNQVLTVETLVAWNAWWHLRWGMTESGLRLSVLCWWVRQESGFSRREDVFTFNLFSKEILWTLYFKCGLQR
jgi:hypothetical protein